MKFKCFISIIASLFFLIAAQAQNTDDVGKIALSVVMPENIEGLSTSQLSKLESKIIQITTKAGLSALGYNQNFVIYPKFNVYSVDIIEGGMQNIIVVTAELSLYIKQTSSNILFSSVSKNIKGSGKNKELAMNNAIAQISTIDKSFASFMIEGKNKILKYYETHCDNIIKKADGYIQMQQFTQALGLLMSIPEEIQSCHDKVIEKSIATFKAYQNQICNEKMQQARAKFAAQDYNGALEILAGIDPSANCFNESQKMIKSVENKVSTEVKKQWDFKMKQYNNEISLEKQRINAIKEIAVSYYKSQPTTLNYNYIIR